VRQKKVPSEEAHPVEWLLWDEQAKACDGNEQHEATDVREFRENYKKEAKNQDEVEPSKVNSKEVRVEDKVPYDRDPKPIQLELF
jgi:hypothetical protein